MKRIDYLKLAIKNPIHRTTDWVFSCFALMKTNENVKDILYLKVNRTDTGYFFYNDKAELEKIEDADISIPLFKFLEKVTIDSSWAENVSSVIETSIGNILFNAWSIVPNFGKKLPFQTGKVGIDKIENIISANCLSVPKKEEDRSTEHFYIDEYLNFVNTLPFIETFANIAIVSATETNMTPPKGIAEYKAKLLKEYEGKLHDPVVLAEFEAKLRAYDKEYLKDDPSLGVFVTGKILNNARKKMFLNYGAEQGFTDKVNVNPIPNSLDEGWSTDPEHFKEMMNGLRSGSYFRGAETVNGGVAAKVLLRASNNFIIEDKDCGSKLGIDRNYNENNIDNLVGRYILEKNSLKLVENINSARNYLNKDLIIRSPMYCKLENDKLCKVCSGIKLFQFKESLAITLTDISNILLYAAMKKMHNTALTTAKLDLNKYLT